MNAWVTYRRKGGKMEFREEFPARLINNSEQIDIDINNKKHYDIEIIKIELDVEIRNKNE